MSEPTQTPTTPALSPIEQTALALAHKWRLVTEAGEICCLRDGCPRFATLPSLLCAEHLVGHRRGWR